LSKIKDENSVKDEEDFDSQIKEYLKLILGKDYTPKNTKIRFETKNAFVTMNSQRDSEEFIRKFQEYAKENPTGLFFNLYKSKVERISANAYFKKFNTFNDEGGMSNKFNQKPRYQKFNDFGGGSNMSTGQMGEQRYKTFNNFDDTSNLVNPYQQTPYRPQPQQFNQFNNFSQNQQTPTMGMNPNMGNMGNPNMPNMGMQKQPQMPIGVDLNDDDSIGEFIYNYVEKIYPVDAAKITGMLMDFDLEYKKKLITGRNEEFLKIVRSAHDLLTKQK